MTAILSFLFFLINTLLSVVVWLIIINAIVSWLIAFDIVNLRNRAAYNIVTMLDRVTAPLLRPFRRLIPPVGGLDLTPMILVVVIVGVQRYLLPALFTWLAALFGGTIV